MKRKLLEKGTKIEFLGKTASVLKDFGEKVEVLCDDESQSWDWCFGGICCQVCN